MHGPECASADGIHQPNLQCGFLDLETPLNVDPMTCDAQSLYRAVGRIATQENSFAAEKIDNEANTIS